MTPQVFQLLGFTERQREEFAQVASEMIADNAAAEVIQGMSESDKSELSKVIAQGGDVADTMSKWIADHYADDPRVIAALQSSVNRSLDQLSQELWRAMTPTQRQQLQTMSV
jgi:hypothetical protein